MTPRKQQDIYEKRDELLALIPRIDERTKVIPDINDHLAKLNGNVADAVLQANIAREIGKSAQKKADEACDMAKENRGDYKKLLIANLAAALSAVGLAIYVVLEKVLDVI